MSKIRKAYNEFRGIKKIRPMIKYIKTLKWPDIQGVEIGVRNGDNSISILKNLDMAMLYCVDPYKPYKDISMYYSKELQDKYYLEAFNKLGRKDNVTFIRKTSLQAKNSIPDNLDFVYVDGDHSYQGVKLDLENYWPKLRQGGILGGDDYDGGHYYGVMKAVDCFIEKHNLVFHGGKSDWWVVKK